MSKTFCPLPFNHLYIHPAGVIKPCCRFAETNTPSDSDTNVANEEVLDNLLYNESHVSIREKMLSGEKVSGCRACYIEEEKSTKSMRTQEMELWGNYDYWKDKSPTVEYVEITFGNYCNLACRTCSSGLSSSWEKEDRILTKFYPDRQHMERMNVDRIWKANDFKNIKRLKVTGGEPMLHPDFPKFLDTIIDSGYADNIYLMIFTNTSYIPKQKLLDRLLRFKSVGVWLSIDGTESVQNYIRHLSDWEVVDAAARKWCSVQRETNNQMIINLGPTYSIYNIMNIPKLFKWWIDLRNEILGEFETQDTTITNNVLSWPDYLNIKHTPNKVKAIHELTKFKLKLDTTKHLPNVMIPIIDNIITNIEKPSNDKAKSQFIRFTKDLDLLRGQDFRSDINTLSNQFDDLWDKIDSNEALHEFKNINRT